MQITRVAIHRPVTVFMAVTAVVLFGWVSLDRLALNLLPEISYPSLTVQTDYEDAAPEEIESLLTRPVEESVGVVPGLNRISSISRPGQSEVVLEFNWSVDMDFAAIEVREKLDLIEFPRDAKRPVILRFDPANDPILRLQVHGQLTLAQLRDIAEREFKKRLESVEGVAAVKVTGGREEQIRIELDERRLAELGIPITQVSETLRQENLNQASGSLYDLDMNYMVRMVNEFRSVDEIRNIVISDDGGRRVMLRDIARIWRGSKERDIIARFNGQESVSLAVYKEGDANTVTASRAVVERLDLMKGEPTYPVGVETDVVFDQARFITDSVNNVLSAAVVGGLLATFVLFVFLRDGPSTAIIAASIPVSVMATFAAMYQSGITLNIMSLGGVALGVGMLVDNSIVVLEAVHRHRKAGTNLADAVYAGASEVSMPVTASTLTTVAVFAPLVFVEGIAGQLFRDQALTITFSLLASLAVALTMIPMLLSVRLEREPDPAAAESGGRGDTAGQGIAGIVSRGRAVVRFVAHEAPRIVMTDIRHLLQVAARFIKRAVDPLLNRFDAGFEQLTAHYSSVLEASLTNKRLVLAAVLGAVVLAAVTSRFLGAELIPPLTQGEFSFTVTLPQGRPLESTDTVVRGLETRAQSVPGVRTVFSSIGGSQENQFASGDLEENVGTLHVVLQDPNDKIAEENAIRMIREMIRAVPEAEQQFERPTLFSFKTPIEVEIFAYELKDQRRAAELVATRMAQIEGLGDIETTTELGNPEIQIRFDRRRLNRLGLEEDQVGRVLRNKIRGDVASRYREDDRQIDILVRVDEPERDTVEDVRNMVINAAPRRAGTVSTQPSGDSTAQQPSGDDDAARTPAETAISRRPFVPVRLGQVAAVKIRQGPAEIRRVRSQRAAIVRANLTGRDLGSVSDEIREALNELSGQLPLGTTAAISGQNEELEVSYRSLGFAMALAVFLVYLVMASQFESLLHPFVILLTVPLGLVGVVFALALTGTNLSVVVLLGAIVLAGIAVNNAIVLVDYTNRLRAEGVERRAALIRACRVRLRPILMTSLTTLLGLVPMALGWGEGDEVRAPIAIAVIGGLLCTTPLTLIVIPVLYEAVDRKRMATGRASDLSEGVGPIMKERLGPAEQH